MIIDKLNDILNANDHETTAYIISAFMKSNILKMRNMTVDEAAKACFVSKGQISKYVRSLGFSHWTEFKEECIEYCQSRRERYNFFSPDKTLQENSQWFLDELISSMRHAQKRLDYARFEKLVQDIQNSENIYLYARGNARTLCSFMQVEFSTFFKNVLICDADFGKGYHFGKKDLLIFLSVNGNSFTYAKKNIARLEQADVQKWLITCQKTLKFSGSRLIIPSDNQIYNEYTMKYVIDLLVAELHRKNREISL